MQQPLGFFGREVEAEEEMGDTEQLFEAEQRAIDAAGLPNTGNSCFVNASVQMLRAARVDWPEGKRSSFFLSASPDLASWTAHLRSLRPDLINGVQQDAGEFVQFLLEENEKPFAGSLRSSVTCEHCGARSEREEAFSLLSLPLPTDWLRLVQVVCVSGIRRIVISLKVERSCTMGDVLRELKKELSSNLNLNLKLVDIHAGRIFSVFEAAAQLKDFHSSQRFYCYAFAPEIKMIPPMFGENSGGMPIPPPPPPMISGTPPPPPPAPISAKKNEDGEKRILSFQIAHRAVGADGRAKLFGFPVCLVSPAPGGCDVAMLRARLARLFFPLTNDASTESSDSIFGTEEKNLWEKNGAPSLEATLLVCNPTGARCGLRGCGKKNCLGCPLVSLDAYDEKKNLLVAEWPAEAAGRWRGTPPLTCHPSVARHREEGEEKKTLDECLEAFERPTQLDKDNAVRCDSCGQKSLSFLASKVEQTSARLVVLLNRFPRKQFAEKLDIEVLYPLQWRVSGKLFFLSAVICHVSARAGTSAGGHYYCVAKNSTGDNGGWRKFDDAFVSVISEERVATKNAYLLLYSAADK